MVFGVAWLGEGREIADNVASLHVCGVHVRDLRHRQSDDRVTFVLIVETIRLRKFAEGIDLIVSEADACVDDGLNGASAHE